MKSEATDATDNQPQSFRRDPSQRHAPSRATIEPKSDGRRPAADAIPRPQAEPATTRPQIGSPLVEH